MVNTIDEAISEAKAFVAERDEVLMSGDLMRLKKFHDLHNPEGQTIGSIHMLEICLHKCRTGATTLPKGIRIDSYYWLKERGMESMDDEGIEALIREHTTIN